MDDFLNAAQLANVRAILAYWDMPPITAIVAFAKDRPVFKIMTVGPTFILKEISNAPDLTRLVFTRRVLMSVASTGLCVPLPLLTRSAQPAVLCQGRFYLLYEFIEADPYPQKPELQAELFYHTGQAIAKLHQGLAAYPAEEVRHQTWHEDFASRVAGWIAALSAGLPASQAAVVQRIGLARGDEIATALRGLPEQLIHRDCHPGNMLVQGTQVIGFIDYDDLCFGLRLFDLAYFAVHHLKWVTDDAVATERWLHSLPQLLAGYRSQQSLSGAEAAAFPYALMAYHLLLSHWYMGLPRRESIALELQALDWVHTHFDAILNATR